MIFVAVGRVDANKNHEMLIRAFAHIASDFPEYKLIIYGEGELRQSLIQLTHELKLKERIMLPGSVTDVAGSIYKASAFALTSYSEGMPNTLLEAMALGIPSISTDCPCGGPRDLIVNGENGLLVPPGDWKKMAENLHNLLTNKEYAKKMGEKASKVQEEFNPDMINQTWKKYLEHIINSSKRTRGTSYDS